ncbi:MAG: hypothetical protein FJ148_23070 [Deltaproteobacteria bacterium]|nr:hypothetical protein [Deltaproteobacteria bacterium]
MKSSVLAVALLALAVGCAQEPPPKPYPQELIDNFMRGCREQRLSDAACRCALDRFQRRWTADEFRAVEGRLGDGDAAAAQVAETVAACAER